MALTITATQVIPGADAALTYGIAGATITAGQAVYLGSDNLWKLIDANDTTTNTYTPGIAVNGASTSQPVTVQTGGTLTLGAGAAPTLGIIYIVGATAGDIEPASALASGWRTIILGVGGASNTIVLRVFNSGQTKA
jgi:hypothetical protein